jgi:hypothetical protein
VAASLALEDVVVLTQRLGCASEFGNSNLAPRVRWINDDVVSGPADDARLLDVVAASKPRTP